MTRWTQAEAIKLCKLIEKHVPGRGGHVALTGGLLYKNGARKDCDVLVYRIRQAPPVDFEGLFGDLNSAGVVLVKDHGWCKKAMWNGKPFDIFDPESSGEHCS